MRYKVKIKKLPQAKYGLSSFLGYNTQYFGDGNSEKSDEVSVKKGLTKVPRNQANLEAEGGETAYGDINGDGMAEHYNINGPRHTNGGVPLNLPEDTFIYSDTKDMKLKDPNILAKFGKSLKSNKAYTPAQLAKQYDINKYRAILQDENSDKYSRDTAELMIKNYNEKLGALALAQEAKKGFPQGVPSAAMSYLETNQISEEEFMPQQAPMTELPAMMAYGGALPKFAKAGINPYEQAKTKEGNVTPTGKQNKFSERKQKLEEYLGQWESNIPGISNLSEGEAQKAIYDWSLQNNPDAIKNMWKTYGITAKGKKNKDLYGLTKQGSFDDEVLNNPENLKKLQDAYVDNYFGVRQLDPITKKPILGPENQPQSEVKEQVTVKEEPKGKSVETDEEVIEDNYTEVDPATREYDTPWWTPDVVNYTGALTDLYRTKKYTPWAPRFEPELADADYLDPTRELAAQSEQANIMAQGLGQFAGPQAFSARASGIQGSAAKNAADTLSRYNNANVQINNSVESQNAQTLNQSAQVNQQLQDQLYDQYTMLNQQFDNTQAGKRDNLRKYFGAGFKNASETAALNAMYPQYKTDPVTGEVVFTEGKQLNPEQQSASFRETLLYYKTLGYGDEAAIKAAKTELGLIDDEEAKTPPVKGKYGMSLKHSGFNYGSHTFPFY